MTHELNALVCAILVQILSIALAGWQMNRELGKRYNAGPRDETPQQSPLLGRLRRAANNGFEGLILFAPAAITVAVTGQPTRITVFAAWAYVVARLLYIPAYAFGLAPWRSIIWLVGLIATLTLLGSAFF